MKRVIAIANQKGGVGKTTTAVNLAADLNSFGKRVLVIDLDPQGNASTGFGVSPEMRVHNTADIVTSTRSLDEAIVATELEGVYLAPSSLDLSSVDQSVLKAFLRAGGLAMEIADLRNARGNDFDLVLIDCPPSLSLLTIAALAASDLVLVPLQAEFFALEGLSQLMLTVREVRKSLNPRLEIGGIILTMLDARNRLSREIERDVRQNLGDLVLHTVIPRNVRVSEAQSFGRPLRVYDPRSRAAVAYHDLAQEILDIIDRSVKWRQK